LSGRTRLRIVGVVALAAILLSSALLLNVPGEPVSQGSPVVQGALAGPTRGETPSSVDSEPVPGISVTASATDVLQGDAVTFTATPPSGVTLDEFSWQPGDGSQHTTSVPALTYTYPFPGEYLVYVEGFAANGTAYDNLHALLPFTVEPSYGGDVSGDAALLEGALQQNSTSNRSVEADIAPGGSVLVADWVDAGPSSPWWVEAPPNYSLSASAVPFAALSPPVLNLTGINAEAISFSASTPFGVYQLVFTETTSSTQAGGGSVTAEFVFSIVVSIGALTAASPLPVSPHVGTLNLFLTSPDAYQFYADPGTAYSVQQTAFDDDVYQTLVAFNGSQAGPNPSDFVPDLATCVPGPQCQARYGSSLIASNGDWTFVLNPNATFYDPTTGAHYPVTPNDVAFSFVRACLFTDYPFYTIHGSWVLCQALLPSSGSNPGWDSGLHAPLNSTADRLLAAVTVNDSAYCTPAMMNGVQGAGCITLHTALSGQAWPELLDFVASPYGASIVSCRWATSEGFGLPGWETGSACNGAPPSPASVGNTSWDAQEIVQGGDDWGGVRANTSSALAYQAVASGPYALASVGPGGDMVRLVPNPFWGGTDCTGGLRAGCLPPANGGKAPTTYIGDVNLFFNASGYNQTEAVLNGSADLAGLVTPLPPAFLQHEDEAGTAQLVNVPSIGEMDASFAMNVNLTEAQALTATPLRFPADLAQDLDFRQFLIYSFPTPTLQSDCIVDEIEQCFQAGGAIPAYMAPYYPLNVSWYWGSPDPNPNDIGGAAWWWNQTVHDGMDGLSCQTSDPCTFPIVYLSGYWTSEAVFQAWASEIQTLSDGALVPVVVPLSFVPWYGTLQSPEAAPVNIAQWLPDFFDPSDYANPYYEVATPSSFYAQDSLDGELETNATLDGPCAGPQQAPVVTNACQGSAFAEMQRLLVAADGCAPPTCSNGQRALLYNMAEQIARSLGLYQNAGQQVADYLIAPWIDPTTVPRSPTMSQLGGQAYYIQYRGSVPYGYPLIVGDVSDPAPAPAATPATAHVPRLADRPSSGSELVIEAGETIVLSVTAAGGSGIYHFAWIDLPAGCSSSNSPFVICTPTAGGNVSVSAVVTDSIGDQALSGSLAIGVASRAAIQGVAISPASVSLGGSVAISVAETGGLLPLTFSYLGLPPGCLSSNSTQLNCTPTAAGTYAVVAEVVDRLGITALGSASLSVVTPTTVVPPPAPAPTKAAGWSNEDVILFAAGALASGFLLGAVTVWTIRRRKPPPDKGSSLPSDRTDPPS
jgi:hypothetical protein